ncbi:MAG: hypothetical protein ABEI53_00045 [Candidatus Magasanikbacteria bacterium]
MDELKEKFKNIKRELKGAWDIVLEEFGEIRREYGSWDKILSTVNVVFLGILLGLLVFGLLAFVSGRVREAIEDTVRKSVMQRISESREDILGRKTTTKGNVVSTSFTDLFSGVGWINQEETTMYHDKVVTSFSFSPEFSWNRIEKSSVSTGKFFEVEKSGSYKKCAGEFCLLKEGLNLFCS